jgi:hypothetical protein
VTWGQALAWRLQRQLLDPPAGASAAAVVRTLGAVLSVDESLAELAVRTRRPSSRPGELAVALAEGSVIAAFAFRGALHYLSPEDGGDILALRSAGRQWELPSWVEHYGLTPEDWPGFRAAVREALSDGPLTVVELGEVLTAEPVYRHLHQVFAEGAGTLIKPLSWQGDVSIGPSRDGRLTLQRLDANPRWRGLPDLEDAGRRAVLAYVRTYGPATDQHLHYWLGEGLSAGRRRLTRWIHGLRDELATVTVEGASASVLRTDLDALATAQPSAAVRFLPGHDQWVMGVGTKDVHVVPAEARERVTRKANLVVVGGVVRGTWTRRGDEITVVWSGPTSPSPAALQEEATRLGIILQRELRVTVA